MAYIICLSDSAHLDRQCSPSGLQKQYTPRDLTLEARSSYPHWKSSTDTEVTNAHPTGQFDKKLRDRTESTLILCARKN